MLNIIKGKKLGMTSVFDGSGTTLPATLIRPFRMVVTGLKTPERDGYAAVQVAYDETTAKHVNRPMKGVLARAGVKGYYRKFFEAKVQPEELDNYTLGQEIDPAEFLDYWGEVDIWGTSKGKGFAGGVKRWGFAGQQRTHGDPDNRRPQSGGATDPARVFKGSHRPGRMGNRRATVHQLSCFEYHHAINVLVVQGSVPGPNGGEVTLKVRRRLSDEEVQAIQADREAMDGALQERLRKEREEMERKAKEEAARKAREEAEREAREAAEREAQEEAQPEVEAGAPPETAPTATDGSASPAEDAVKPQESERIAEPPATEPVAGEVEAESGDATAESES